MESRVFSLLLLTLSFVTILQPGGSLPAEGREPNCSAAKLSKRLTPQPGLPPAVARMRQAIANAAIECDYAKLQTLAHSKFGFRIGFQERGSLQQYLLQSEEGGGDLLKRLVELLNEPYTTGLQVNHKTEDTTTTKNYFWPKVDLPPDRYFYGYFITITEDGQWTAFGNAD